MCQQQTGPVGISECWRARHDEEWFWAKTSGRASSGGWLPGLPKHMARPSTVALFSSIFRKRRAGVCKHVAWVEGCPCTKQAIKIHAVHFARTNHQTTTNKCRAPEETQQNSFESRAKRKLLGMRHHYVHTAHWLRPKETTAAHLCSWSNYWTAYSSFSHFSPCKSASPAGPKSPESPSCISRLPHTQVTWFFLAWAWLMFQTWRAAQKKTPGFFAFLHLARFLAACWNSPSISWANVEVHAP